MTQEQEAQLRTILEVEGFTPSVVEQLVTDSQRKPDLVREFLGSWKLVTETKQ